MTITKPDYQFPEDLEPTSAVWEFAPNIRTFDSIFTNTQQSIESQGHKFKASLSFDLLTQEQLRLASFVEVSCMGGVNTIAIPMFGYSYLGIHKDVEATVDSLLNNDHTKVVSVGWTANAKPFIKGDMIAINGELKMIASDVIADESGTAIIEVNPAMRQTPPVNSVITYDPPIVTMRKTPDSESPINFSIGNNGKPFSAITMAFDEAVFQ